MKLTINHGRVTIPHLYAHAFGHDIIVSMHITGEPTIETRRGTDTASYVSYEVELHAAEKLATDLEELAKDVRAAAAEIQTADAERKAVAP